MFWLFIEILSLFFGGLLAVRFIGDFYFRAD